MIRAGLQGKATVHVDGERIPCDAIDVGLGGMAVVSDRSAPSGFVRIEFRVHEDSSWFDVAGVVVRQQPRDDGALWGVQFHGLDMGTRTRLRNYVQERRRP